MVKFVSVKDALDWALEEMQKRHGFCEPTIVHGGANGADNLSNHYALNYHLPVERHPAAWEVHTDECPAWHKGQKKCKMAGYRRNREMADLLNPETDIVVAIKKRGAGNRGTQMMIDLCKKRGLRVEEFWEE